MKDKYKRLKPVVILEWLLRGGIIRFVDREYQLVDNKLCTKVDKIQLKTGQIKKDWMNVNCDLKLFITMCNKLTDEVALRITGNLAINDITEDKEE